MRRLVVLPTVLVLVPLLASACGPASGSATETLPPIKTTTSTTTSTTTPDMRRIFYEVKSGDNLSDIARAYGVPREQIVQLNNLPNGGQTIQIGQIIEIPNDMRLDDSLPPIAESTTSLSP